MASLTQDLYPRAQYYLILSNINQYRILTGSARKQRSLKILAQNTKMQMMTCLEKSLDPILNSSDAFWLDFCARCDDAI